MAQRLLPWRPGAVMGTARGASKHQLLSASQEQGQHAGHRAQYSMKSNAAQQLRVSSCGLTMANG